MTLTKSKVHLITTLVRQTETVEFDEELTPDQARLFYINESYEDILDVDREATETVLAISPVV